MNRAVKWVGGVVLAVSLLYLPRLFSLDYYLHIFIMAAINAILALSLGLIIGFAGQVSLCHAAFYGVGAYTSALMGLHFGLSFWVTLWFGGLLAGLLAFALGQLVLRLKGHFLAITTAFFGVLVTVVLNNWVDLTKGPMGLPGIPRPMSGSFIGLTFTFESRAEYYYLALLFVVMVSYMVYRIVNSRIGKALIAIRENEELAQSIGIDTMRYKLFAFALGSAFAGIAGAFYAHYILFISPVTFTIGESINILVMVIFGGMTTLTGPILGAVILTILPEFLRLAGALRLVIYGLALMVFIIWMPLGIVGTLKEFLFQRPTKSRTATATP
jgi:branched-chain amino acid transport system permease protein